VNGPAQPQTHVVAGRSGERRGGLHHDSTLFTIVIDHQVDEGLGAEILDNADPAGNRTTIPDDDNRLFVIVTISGGGTRAAGFGYAVLKELQDTKLNDGTTLLKHVKVISSVSGGTFAALDYGLRGDQMLANFEKPRIELFHFFEWLRDHNTTTFLIQEQERGSQAFGKYDEDFLSDAILHLRMAVLDDINVQRRIRAVKVRNANHSQNYFQLLLQDGRFQTTKIIEDKMR